MLNSITPQTFPTITLDDLNDTIPTKKWSVVALLVGIVITGVGGVGTLFLLNSYQVFHLPACFSGIYHFCSNTPHIWSLWAMASGIVVGGVTIAISSHKIHKAREFMKPKKNYIPTPLPVQPTITQENAQKDDLVHEDQPGEQLLEDFFQPETQEYRVFVETEEREKDAELRAADVLDIARQNLTIPSHLLHLFDTEINTG